MFRKSLVLILAILFVSMVADSGIKKRVVSLAENASIVASSTKTLTTPVNSTNTINLYDPQTAKFPDSLRAEWTVLDSSGFSLNLTRKQVPGRPLQAVGIAVGDSTLKTASSGSRQPRLLRPKQGTGFAW
jgi:hypothetical protein